MTSSTPFEIRLGREWPVARVLYLDADLLVLDKPAGLLSSPDGLPGNHPYAAQLLRALASRAPWRPAGVEAGALVNAHRLDRDTTGVMLFAWHRAALAGLLRQFRARTVGKTYLALVHGNVAQDEQRIEVSIIPDRRRPGLSTIAGRSGLSATTEVRVLERFGAFTLVQAAMQTGRHHQIRVHLRSVGHPLVGDTDYGGRPLLLSELKVNFKAPAEGERPLLGRHALHAWRVAFRHPASDAMLSVDAPWPKDLSAAVRQLQRSGPRAIGL